MPQSSVIAALQYDLVSRNGTQEEEYLESNSHETIVTPHYTHTHTHTHTHKHTHTVSPRELRIRKTQDTDPR